MNDERDQKLVWMQRALFAENQIAVAIAAANNAYAVASELSLLNRIYARRLENDGYNLNKLRWVDE